MGFIIKILLHVTTTAGVLWAFDHYLFEDFFNITGDSVWMSYGLVAFVFGVLNTFIKPLLKILMLPVQFFTLGLAGLALNGVILWGVQQVVHFTEINNTQVEVDGLLMYLIIGIALGITNTIIHWVE